jgi:hypothetical protein
MPVVVSGGIARIYPVTVQRLTGRPQDLLFTYNDSQYWVEERDVVALHGSAIEITSAVAARMHLLSSPSPSEPKFAPREQAIRRVCDEVAALLCRKNMAYGDSALAPLRVFSRANAVEQLRVRIDDKLSRLVRGDRAGEDTVLDLIGYLVLLLIAERDAGVENVTHDSAPVFSGGGGLKSGTQIAGSTAVWNTSS